MMSDNEAGDFSSVMGLKLITKMKENHYKELVYKPIEITE